MTYVLMFCCCNIFSLRNIAAWIEWCLFIGDLQTFEQSCAKVWGCLATICLFLDWSYTKSAYKEKLIYLSSISFLQLATLKNLHCNYFGKQNRGCQLPDFSLRSPTFCYTADFSTTFLYMLKTKTFCASHHKTTSKHPRIQKFWIYFAKNFCDPRQN